jgi:DNA-directed RNA polymerase subunit K/omega
MAIKTVDIELLAAQTGSIYESVAVAAKRARQISTKLKSDLDSKLAYFEGFEPELEDPRFQEEQLKTSLQYEVMDEPTELAIGEMYSGEVYFRDSSSEIEP